MHSSLAGLDNLPAIARTLLYLLASSGAGKSKNALLKQLQALKCRGADGRAISHQSLTELLKTLQQSGWIKPPEEGQPLRLAEDYRNPLLLHMQELPEAPAWRRTLLTGLPLDHPPWQPASRPQLLHRIWLHLLDDDLEGLINGLILLNRNTPLPTLATLHPLPALLADDAGHQLFASRHEDIRQLLQEHYLELSNTYLAPASSAYALGLEQLHGQITDDLALQLSLQACWRGDWNALRQLQRPSLGLLQQSIQHLLRGQAEDTLHLLRSWLGEQRRLTKKRKIDLPPILNGLYCLALFAENQPQHYPQLKQALALGNKEGYGAAYPVLQHLFEQLQGAKRQSLPGYLLAKPNGFDGLMLALGLYWLDAPEARQPEWRKTLQDYRDQLVADDYHWLAAEFDALLAQQFGLPRQLAASHQDSGLQPLVKLHQRQESWQQALTALSLIRPGKGAANSAQSKSRLIWLIQLARYERRVEPLEQKLGAKGQWSKGRVVSLKRLAEETASLDYLSDQDRQVIACIRPGYSYHGGLGYELPPEQALPHLVGHPALYWKDAPETRIDLQAGQPSLYLDERAGQIHLHLEPRDLGDHDDLLLHKETPTRLRLYPISRELRQIAEIIGSGLSVPLSAKTQVVETLGSIAPLLPVHSEIPELAGQLDSVAADPRLYAHLLPLQEGLRLQLLVRPLAEGSWLRPGHGAQSLLGEQDGKSVQAQRDLAAERQALQQVLNACPGLANADSDGQEWQLDQPQDALQVLSELHALDGNTLHCVWPEGERMRIKGRSGLQQLRLGLKQQGNWFALQGEITLDDGKVLQLRQLLDLLKARPGRFLKLDERDWLALDDSLRKRLDELAHLAERVSDQGLRLSPLSAPLLAELASEAGEFEADAKWRAHLDKLESLRHYRPQLPGTLQAQLRDYQHDGFVWLARLAHWGVGACLADDMGLGKTVQTLALLLHRAADGPQLVVAPTSVALNWLAESQRFAPTLKLRLYQQQRSLDDLGPLDLVIVSYGLLQQDSAAFAARRWTSVVLDEAQAIKNAQTKRSQAVMALQADFRLIATGTPLENHLSELWNLFRFINPALLGSQDSFTARFVNPIENGDAAARRALKQLIQPFILRRLKSQVLDELPPRTEITYKVPLSDDEAHQYEALRQQAVKTINQLDPDAGKPLQVLAEITRLRRFCCHPSLVLPGSELAGSKLLALREIIAELLANRHKALVFSQFVDHLQIVRTWLDQQGIAYQYLDGATPAKERKKRVDAFQAGSGELFLISLKAGGSGLNLTAADYVIHLDPWWNPAVEDQASDRAHRMGQQRPVTIYRLVAEGTIEEQIVALHGRKRDLADSLLEGGEVSAKLDADALLQLLKG